MRATIVSPHLDDAILSVGGTIHLLKRRGVDVHIVTVFAGDPDADSPPSYWDATRGAHTQGAAVRMRRAEDAAAAAALGATATALRWPDSGYAGRRDPEAIWSQLAPAIESADLVMLPGWPLSHADHRYATLLVLERSNAGTTPVFYAEQPYAVEPVTLLKGRLRGRTVAPLRHAADADLEWRRVPLGRDARAAQERALAHYAGELANLGLRGRWARLVRGITRGEWLGVDASQDLAVDLFSV